MLLRRLGEALAAQPEVFGAHGRPGGLFDALVAPRPTARMPTRARHPVADPAAACRAIWPAGKPSAASPLGDCWRHDGRARRRPHRRLGAVPQAVAVADLLAAGAASNGPACTVDGLDALTGLPEYRNGGLLLDTGVLAAARPGVRQRDLASRATRWSWSGAR